MNQSIDYVGVEAYPISAEELVSMNYVEELNATDDKGIFEQMHQCNWEENETFGNDFSLTKRKQLFEEINDLDRFDLIYQKLIFDHTIQMEYPIQVLSIMRIKVRSLLKVLIESFQFNNTI